jgi:hypothetical protein
MTRRLLFVCIALFSLTIAKSQGLTVKGTINDQQTKAPLVSATVKISSLSDSTTTKSVLTDSAGKFSFGNLVKDSFLLSVSYVGYSPVSRIIAVDTSDIDLKIAAVPGAATDLSTVIITTTISPVTQKGDTLQFNASQFKVNPDATSEDLVKKVPGITVENGQVKAQGEVVQRVTLDGRELFGDDATAALRNLPAEVVDKIQVLDRLSDQDRASGVVTGDTQKEINIVTKAGMRNGQYGRVFGGYGTDDRYTVGGNATFLKENRRIALVGQSNNINQQNFSQQDLLGVTSSGNNRGGFGGGNFGGGARGAGGAGNRGAGGGGGGNFGGGMFGGGNNFLVGQQNGINTTNAFGLNYSDNWGKKIRMSGSYFFNNTKNITEQITKHDALTNESNTYNRVTKSEGTNFNHRFSMRLEYNIDSFNRLIISPNISFQKNNTTSLSTNNITAPYPQITINNNQYKRSGSNMNNNILYSHNFRKRGRVFSVNLNTSYNYQNGDNYADAIFIIPKGPNFDTTETNNYTDSYNNGLRLNANVSYVEPISKKSQIQFTYNPSYTKSSSDQKVYDFDPASQTYSRFVDSLYNVFDNYTTTQNGGVAYRYGTLVNQLTVGVNYQNAELENKKIHPETFNSKKSFQDILPNAMMRFKLSSRSNLRIFYRASTNPPSVTQLQDVVNISNRPFLSVGNPDLKQQYSHMVNGNYTYTHTGKGIVFVAGAFAQKINNYIANATYTIQDTAVRKDSLIGNSILMKIGEQLTKPVNLDGYVNLRSFITFAVPVKFIKSNLNLNSGISYQKQPGLINSNYIESQSYTYSLGSVIASNVSEFVDFTVSYTANFNRVNATGIKNNQKVVTTNNYFNHVGSVQFNLLTKKGWFLQNDLNNNLYSGYGAGVDQNYWLWNLAAGKKFLKNRKGELKLSVFDLLEQNVSITREIADSYIEDVRNRVLTRYFMLTFTYNLRNFGKPAPPSRGNFNRGGEGFDRGNQRF